MVVDGVSDVITLAAEQIKPAPSLGNDADTSHIIGFGTLDERMRILMDVEKLMASADTGLGRQGTSIARESSVHEAFLISMWGPAWRRVSPSCCWSPSRSAASA